MGNQRSINQDGINIIKSFEGLEDGDPTTVNLDPYICPAGIWTIGWGHAIYYDKRILKSKNPGDKKLAYSLYPGGITIKEAEILLSQDLHYFNYQLSLTLDNKININQFSALVSFTYNVGLENFRTSTLRKRICENDMDRASNEFGKWIYSNKKVLNGLVKRRYQERDLFLKPEDTLTNKNQ